MNLTSLNLKISELLAFFQVRDLPYLPNLNGIFESTDITYALVSGQRLGDDRDYVTIKINVSVAATLRMSEQPLEDEKNLYGLVSAVIYQLQKKKVEAGGLIRFLSFENFTPESGKWRSLLTFEVDIPIQSEVDFNGCLTILEGLG
jgi:hypothetical protein